MGEYNGVAFALRNRDRGELAGDETSGDGRGGSLLAAQGEGVLVFARDGKLVGEVFGGFAHGVGAVKPLHFGIHKAPAEGAVVHLAVAAKGLGGLRQCKGRAGHVLYATGQQEVAFVGLNGT